MTLSIGLDFADFEFFRPNANFHSLTFREISRMRHAHFGFAFIQGDCDVLCFGCDNRCFKNVDIAETVGESLISDDEGELGDEEIAEAPSPRRNNSVKRSKETQDYIDLVESTFEKFVRLTKEGFVNLWYYFSGLIEKFSKP